MTLADALSARRGVICVVGAGGKKSTLYALARRLDRAVVTATVRIPIFDQHVADVVVTDRPVAALERATDWPVGVVPNRDRDDRYRGYDTDVVDAIGESGVADAVLVKADGARMREFKAPGDREPQLPATADTVLPIASVHAVGEPLTEDCVHRPERVTALTDLEVGDTIRPSDIATVLISGRGGRADVPDDATVVPVLNKVDDAALEAVAREIASDILARSNVPHVALTQMTASEPVVAVVER
ncbi:MULTISPECIES: selenium cofactor biosynthesis protein YqeC [unclassified Haloferax]|uniref:selenium cofactor biosynthesis protein YqeC n=1 Tax=unclassified Haloferax TaxID=2625095 RepID=UPI0002B2335C|nr:MULTISPECIES: selenium cofactor biosynthesis protein YqeC [unclassified Haloferax]ELZ61102.1 anaerobic dehydrogenase [Haloferax sp. ATCC BAA-645]ELZ61696.1 anaerobic dehydrogenase [Haloferax sp. ATCC BAA-646]